MITEANWLALAFYAVVGEAIFLAGLMILYMAKVIMEMIKKE